jgi:hypothetical protein
MGMYMYTHGSSPQPSRRMKLTGGLAQEVEPLPSKHEALSSNSSSACPPQKKKKKKKHKRKKGNHVIVRKWMELEIPF